MDKERYKGYYIKLRREADADVIAALDAVDNRQDYIRRLVRDDMAQEDRKDDR